MTDNKTTLFPFKTYLPPNSNYDLDDGNGTVLTIPRYGCLTWIEDRLINSYFVEAKDGVPMAEARAEIVSRMLQFRAGINKDLNGTFKPKDEILILPDGRPFPNTLVEALFKFFNEDESSGWKKGAEEVPLSPKQADEASENKAEKKK